MSALSVLGLARRAGVRVQLDGDHLELAASSEPPALVLHLLARHKAEVVALLRLCSHGWSAEDWHAYFNERAGIAEYDGKLSRQLAEAQAFASCVVKWRELTLQPSPPGRCVSCGGGEQPGNPLLPYGIGTFSQACLHDHCWPAWHRAGRSEAVEAIKQIGIEPIADRELQEDTLLTVEISFLPWIEASDCGPMDRPIQHPAINERSQGRQQ
jgi:hypothetical protein